MAGEYIMCIRCGNTKSGTEIIECKKCKKMFCSECWDSFLVVGAACPECGHGGLTIFSYKSLGRIP